MYSYFKTAYLCIFCFAYMYILFAYGYFCICMPFLLLHVLVYILFCNCSTCILHIFIPYLEVGTQYHLGTSGQCLVPKENTILPLAFLIL